MDYQHSGKDRPLGRTYLQIKDVAAEGSDKKEQPFVSTGTVSRTSNLEADNGKSMKGNLVYEAIFYPALNLRGVAFAPAPMSPLNKVMPRPGEDDDDDNASIIDPDDDARTVFGDDELSQQMNAEAPMNGNMASSTPGTLSRVGTRTDSPYAGQHTKNALSTASFATAGTTASVTDGITMTREEVLRYRKRNSVPQCSLLMRET
jgi:hypothetical protein